MKCGGCVSRVKRILEGHANVTQVTFVTAQAECAYALRVRSCLSGDILHCNMDRVATAPYSSTI